MKPGKIRGKTRALGPPANWNPVADGECDVLEIRDRDGTMESAWYPTPEEIAHICAGRPVILTVWGQHPPAVSLNVSEAGL